MFDFLAKTFSSIYSSFSSKSVVSEQALKDAIVQVKDALIAADVPYELVEKFVATVSQELIGKALPASIKPAEYFMKTVHDKLVAFLGGVDAAKFSPAVPSIIMLMGLQGAGKTTSIGKLAFYLKKAGSKQNKQCKILVASVDFYRPAAIDQLEIVAKQAAVAFYRAQSSNPSDAALEIYDYWKRYQYDFLLLDTAGRLHVDNTMLAELKTIDSELQPKLKILVLDAMTGQESLAVARAYEQAVGFDGAILAKSDSDSRGGAAFSFRYALQKPVYFVGVGEKVEDFTLFQPERIASRMLGMGDIQTLIERAEEKIKKEEQEKVASSLEQGRFTLHDFAQQMDMVSRLGSLSSVMKYMPGLGGVKVSEGDLERGEREMRRFRAIISSMTPKERNTPSLLNGSRRKRVALGAGVSVSEVDTLLSRFAQMQQYAKLIGKSGGFRRFFK